MSKVLVHIQIHKLTTKHRDFMKQRETVTQRCNTDRATFVVVAIVVVVLGYV